MCKHSSNLMIFMDSKHQDVAPQHPLPTWFLGYHLGPSLSLLICKWEVVIITILPCLTGLLQDLGEVRRRRWKDSMQIQSHLPAPAGEHSVLHITWGCWFDTGGLSL